MADVVTRLVVESKEYDSKIARATSGLTQFEKKCREVGGTLEFVEKEDLAFVQALGQMDTVATTATGKMSELKRAFTELSVQYKNLTEAEKRSPYGKALASSLDQLKGRIKNLQGDLSEAQSDMTGFGDAFKQIGAKMGIPMDMFTKFGPYVAAAGAALKVTTDAFKQNELVMDEWGRTTESAGSVYQGFLNALNTGDLSGFFKNIGKIISKAREAYDAMDQLGTFNAFNKIQTERARTNFTEAIAAYREGTGSKEDVKEAAERLKGEMQTRQEKEQAAYIAAIKELAASRGVDENMLQKALSGTYGDYEKLKALPLSGRKEEQMWNGNMYGNTVTTKVTVFAANEEEKLGQMLRQLNDDELGRIQQLGATAQATATEIAGIDKQLVRVLGGGNKGGGGVKVPVEPVLPEGSAAALKKQISELQKQWETATTQDERNSIKGQIDAANEALNAMIPQAEQVAEVIKDAAFMWEAHTAKIAEVTARLEEFKAMIEDSSLSDAQRDWAAGMADAYQEQLDKMTGATQEAVDEMKTKVEELPSSFEMMRESLDNLSSGVGAISTIGNAFNDLKGIGEDLASAFSGEMDAWDALMTVFNSGISIMQTVIGVMEAINTLQELSSMLSKKKVVEQTAETTAVVAGKGAEMAAETAETAASGAATAANTAEAAAGAGKAMAGIPIVGPVLAIAAIAAVLAAVLAATSKAKSAGKFATGGVVGGNSYSGDKLMAYVNSGETILTPQQADRAVAGIEGAQPQIMIEGRISGTDILLAANNSNRSRGGSRGYYANVH